MTWIARNREEIFVANVDGQIYAMDNICSHSGGSLADGYLRGSVVSCPMHGWEYEVTTGCCTHIRDECLRTYPVIIHDGQILVDVPD